MRATWILTATILGSSLVFIDGTVVSIALPVIQAGFHASAADAQWVIEAYTLVLGALMLLCGALGDRYGRKRLFLTGVVIFAIGSVLCGLAPSMPALIAARVLQGAGGTMLAPASLALLGAFFTGEARGKAIGTWSGLTAVASAVGPVAGGAIVDHFGWRWVFFINVPIAAFVVVLTLLHVSESRDERETGSLDAIGSLLITVALGLIVYAFIMSSTSGWGTVPIGAAVAGVLAIVAFLAVERTSRNPILPLHLFENREFSGINIMTFLLYGALSGLFYFLPFVMIQVDGYSATVAGFAMLPFIVLMVSLSRFSGALVYRIGARNLLIAGPLLTASGFALLAVLRDLHYWDAIFPSALFIGVGMGLTVAPLTTTMMESVPAEHVGLASGINNAASRIAGLLAIAVMGALLGGVYAARLAHRMDAQSLPQSERRDVEAHRTDMAAARFTDPRETAAVDAAYIDGFRVVALACALLAAASAATSATMLLPDPRHE
jgi:EmrB/QacA subfamily drug resistance transporter